MCFSVYSSVLFVRFWPTQSVCLVDASWSVRGSRFAQLMKIFEHHYPLFCQAVFSSPSPCDVQPQTQRDADIKPCHSHSIIQACNSHISHAPSLITFLIPHRDPTVKSTTIMSTGYRINSACNPLDGSILFSMTFPSVMTIQSMKRT